MEDREWSGCGSAALCTYLAQHRLGSIIGFRERRDRAAPRLRFASVVLFPVPGAAESGIADYRRFA